MRLIDRFRSTNPLTLDEWANYFTFNGLAYPTSPRTTLGTPTEEIGGDFQGLVQGAYRSNGVVFACMMVRQLLFQEARFRFRRLQNGRPGEYFGGRELARLEEPYDGGTTGDLLARAIQDVDLAGNWYGALSPSGIDRLRPDFVTIVLASRSNYDYPAVAPDVEVLGYIYDPPQAERRVYLPEEVAHFAPYPDPISNFRGMSWLTPVIRETMADAAATTHKLKFFEQGATPNLVVKFDPGIERDKVQEWIESMEGRIGGAANAYRTLYLGGGADAQAVGSTMRDTTFKEVQGAGETRIAAAAGVPPVVVGLSEGLQAATYSNYSQARRRFADGTMRPLWRNISGSLSKIIRVPRSAELWYDDRDIPFLQEDQKDAADIRKVDSEAIKSLTEAGYDPDSVVDAVTAGDLTRLNHTGVFSVQLQKPGGDSPTPDVPEPPERKVEQRAIEPGESKARKIIARFERTEDEVRDLLEQAVGASDTKRNQLLGTARDAIIELHSEDATDALVEAYDAGFEESVEAFRADPIAGLIESLDEKLTEAVQTAYIRAGDAFRNVTEDNLEDMAQEAVTGFVDDAGRRWSLSAYAGMAVGNLARRATSRGIKDGAGDGLVRFSSHGTTHPACKPLEGQTFPASEAPEPPIHEGCKHTLTPVS